MFELYCTTAVYVMSMLIPNILASIMAPVMFLQVAVCQTDLPSTLPLPSPATLDQPLMLQQQQPLTNPMDTLKNSTINPEEVKKGVAVMGAVVGAMAVVHAVKDFKEEKTSNSSSDPNMLDYMKGSKVSRPATYVSKPAMTCSGQAYCFPQILDKVSAAPQCAAGFTYDAQAIKCYKYTGYECPKGASLLKTNPPTCQLCESKVRRAFNEVGLLWICITYTCCDV
jgi:hypothetical protein